MFNLFSIGPEFESLELQSTDLYSIHQPIYPSTYLNLYQSSIYPYTYQSIYHIYIYMYVHLITTDLSICHIPIYPSAYIRIYLSDKPPFLFALNVQRFFLLERSEPNGPPDLKWGLTQRPLHFSNLETGQKREREKWKRMKRWKKKGDCKQE